MLIICSAVVAWDMRSDYTHDKEVNHQELGMIFAGLVCATFERPTH